MRVYHWLLVLCLMLFAHPVDAAGLTNIWTKNISEDGRIYGFTTWGDGYYGYATADSVKIFDKNGTMVLSKKTSKLYHYLAIGDNCFLIQRGGDGEICENKMFDFSGNELWSLREYGIGGGMFSPNGNYIVYADTLDDMEFRLTTKDGETLLRKVGQGSYFVVFTTDERLLSVSGHGIFRLDGDRVDALVLDENLGFTRNETYFLDNNTKILIRENNPVNQMRLFNLEMEMLWQKEIKPYSYVSVFKDQIYCSTKDTLDIYMLTGEHLNTIKFPGKKISEEVWGSLSGDWCIVHTYIFPIKEWNNIVDRNGNLIQVQEYVYDTNKKYRFNEKAGLLYTLTTTDKKSYILDCYKLE